MCVVLFCTLRFCLWRTEFLLALAKNMWHNSGASILTINLILPISTFFFFFSFCVSAYAENIWCPIFLVHLGIFNISLKSWALQRMHISVSCDYARWNTLVKLVKFTRAIGLPSGKISFVRISFCKVSFLSKDQAWSSQPSRRLRLR